MRVAHGVMLWVLLAGCGGVGSSSSGSSSSGSSSSGGSSSGGATPCELGTLPTSVSVSEGGRLKLPLSPHPQNAVVTASAPPGWSARVDTGPRQLVVRLPYGITGAHPLQLTAQCGSASTTATVEVTVRALSWQQVGPWTPDTEGPPAREHTVLWIDEDNPDRLFLYGGYLFEPRQYTVGNDLWSLNLASGAWQRVTTSNPSPDVAGWRVAPVPGSAAVLLHGGDTSDGSLNNTTMRLRYEGDTPTWSEETTTSNGFGSSLSAFFHDAPRDQWLQVCGIRGQSVHCRVHAYDGLGTPESWYEVEVADDDDGTRPVGRYGFFWAHDEETQRFIMFGGGRYPVSQADPVNAAEDAWALELAENPPRWRRLFETQSVVRGSRNGCWALDTEGHRLFIWGGTPDAATTIPGLYVLDLERGNEVLERIDVPGGPEERSSCNGIYDPARQRVLMGFGNNSQAIYADLWALQL
ncbi:MAG: kelch repeat-containing protein [Myxococcota bacterium]